MTRVRQWNSTLSVDPEKALRSNGFGVPKPKLPRCPTCRGLLPSDSDDPQRVCDCGTGWAPAPKPRTPLSPQGSGVRAASGKPKPAADFSTATKALVELRTKGGCELAGCRETATDHHHRKRRDQGDHSAVNCLRCCRAHHSQAHKNPLWARSLGLIVLTTDDPAEVPMLTDQGWVLLAEDGSYERTSAPEGAGVA